MPLADGSVAVEIKRIKAGDFLGQWGKIDIVGGSMVMTAELDAEFELEDDTSVQIDENSISST